MTDIRRYILHNQEPLVCPDLLVWARWMDDRNNTKIKRDELPDNITVSTVFLGLDHNYGEGKPILFETMIFGWEHGEYQERYCTWDEAIKGHQKAIEMCFEIE